MESTPARSNRASSGSLSPPTPSPPRLSATLPPQAQQARFANKSARAAGLESGSDSSELTDEDEVALRAKHKKKRGRKPRKSVLNNLGNTTAQEQPPPARRPHSRGTSESTVNGAQNGGGSGSGGTSVSGSQTHSNSRSSRRSGVLVPPTMWEWAYKKNKPTVNGLGLEIAPRDGSPSRSHSSGPERTKPLDSVQLSDGEIDEITPVTATSEPALRRQDKPLSASERPGLATSLRPATDDNVDTPLSGINSEFIFCPKYSFFALSLVCS
ncbi:hypothetical protein BDV93DRAFT_213708 [Ceratobasidium sp. AG-I]|nr:hypothetical protein BDV93DRAFT_213708 [Ceratobasidium sp. AG-I]